MIATRPTPLTDSPHKHSDPQAAPIAEAQGTEMREAVRILQRRRNTLVACLVLGVAIAALSILFTQNRYSSTATIEVNRDSSSSLGFTDLSGVSALGDTEGMNVDLLTQQAVILSDNTALRVIEDMKLDALEPYAMFDAARAEEPKRTASSQEFPLERAPQRRDRALRVFRSGLRVMPIKGTRLLTVTFTDTDPKRAAAVANAVVEAYISESTRARFQASSKTSTWLTAQLADLKHRVEESQARVDAFRRTSGLTGVAVITPGRGQPGDEHSSATDNVAVARLIDLNRSLTAAELARIERESVYRTTQTQDPEVVLRAGSGPVASNLGTDSPLATGSSGMPLLQQLRQQLAQIKVQVATEGTKYGARNPVMLQLTNEQASLEAQIRAELDHIRAEAKNDFDLAALDEFGIRRQIAEQERAVNQVTDKADQLLLLEEEARSSREIYQDLYTKLEEASVTAGIKASNVTLVDPARVPAVPSSPRKRLTLALGCISGLIVGLLSGFSLDYFDDSIAMPEDAERATGFPVIGAIPDFHRPRSGVALYGRTRSREPQVEGASSAWLIRSPRSHTAEAYRTLRTALLLARADGAPHTVLFTSGSAEEGKSTTCLNTAAAFAVQGDRVLYLDADLRRATGHTFFRCPNELGLSNCLAGGLTFPAVLKPHPEIASLFLLPAGSHPPNPSELLGSRRFVDLLRELRAHFDYIFIDSPPLLPVTDAQLIAPHCDGCVLVLRAGKTPKRSLQRSIALIRATQASLVGLVINAFKAQIGSYSAYGYYGKGSSYYAEE